MDLKKLLWPTAGVLAVCGVSCAPVAPPAPPTQAAAPVPAAAPVEVLVQAPTPAPEGPRYRIEAAVRNVRERDLLTTNAFWTVFHGILGLGPGVQLLDPDTGTRVNAVEYICAGGQLRGLQFLPTRDGVDVVTTGAMGGGQGHQDQFIAEMAQWGMTPDQKFVVLGKDYTYRDFVRHTQMRARVTANQELSWAIVIISQFVGTDVKWTNAFGERLHFEDLVRYELDASVEQAPCGGTHRLFGLAWARHQHLLAGGRDEGIWQEIAEKTNRYRDIARRLQNADGTFSTEFFAGPGNVADKQRRINSTGHTLEWLSLALPDDELREPWVQDAANALALLILDMQGQAVEGGGLYHAVHGLLMYYARVYDRTTLGPPELLIPLPPGWEGK